MPGETYSANMNLVLPGVGVTPGPDYAVDLNASLSILDGHTHAPGSGVPITPSGLNISSDLSFQFNNALNLRAAKYASQAAPIGDLLAFYVVNGDAYYNDAAGTKIRLTQSGSIAGTTGSISGLLSPASATYVSASQAFVWQSAVNTAASMDFSSAVLRNVTASSFGLTLSPPTLTNNYTITLPYLPTTTQPVSLDVSGNLSAGQIVTSQVTPLHITTPLINTQAVTQVKKEIRTRGTSTAAIGGVATSTIASFATGDGATPNATGLLVSITTLGNPVQIAVVSSGGVGRFGGEGSVVTNGVSNSSASLALYRNGILISTANCEQVTSVFTNPDQIVRSFPFGQPAAPYVYGTDAASAVVAISNTITAATTNVRISHFAPLPGVMSIDPAPAGTNTYQLKIYYTLGYVARIENATLVAYEL